MSDINFEVGQKVMLLDVNKVGEVTLLSDDGSQISVKYLDDAGAEQTETLTADKLAAVVEGSEKEEAAEEKPEEV